MSIENYTQTQEEKDLILSGPVVAQPIIDTKPGVLPEQVEALETAYALPAAPTEIDLRNAEDEKARYVESLYFDYLNRLRAEKRAEDKLKYPPRPGDIIPLQAKLEQERPWLKRIIGSFATNAY